MKINRHTLSLCPHCYQEIPARIEVADGGVTMFKTCPAHGSWESIVETDPLFYLWATNLKAATIYGGHFVDITRTCQLRCRPCYFKLEKNDPAGMFSVEAIVNECITNIQRAPFILTGGEPTLHPKLPEVIRRVRELGTVELLSNGIKLADRDFFREIMPLITDGHGVAHLNLSIHHEESDQWMAVIQLAREANLKIESALIVVRNEDEFVDAIERCRLMRDVVNTFRIKAASNLWNASSTIKRVFVSDMLGWLEERGPVEMVALENNKPCFVNTLFDGMHLMLVSWYDVNNVDLMEINCPPTYRARNGQVANFVTAGLINEGIEKARQREERVKIVAAPMPIVPALEVVV